MNKLQYIRPIPEYIYQYFKNISFGVDYGKDISSWKLLWYEETQFVYLIPSHTRWTGRFMSRTYCPPKYIFVDLSFSKGHSYTLYLSTSILINEGRTKLEKFINDGKEKVNSLLKKQ